LGNEYIVIFQLYVRAKYPQLADDLGCASSREVLRVFRRDGHGQTIEEFRQDGVGNVQTPERGIDKNVFVQEAQTNYLPLVVDRRGVNTEEFYVTNITE
jgi:hypothetical protein